MIVITKTPNADTRTATKPITRELLLESSEEHICHVQKGMEFFSDKLLYAAEIHDWTKINYIDEFTKDALLMKTGNEFKKLPWFQIHISKERHHVLDRCPEDVTLIDLLERVVDTTMAWLSRSGTIYNAEIPSEILQLAYKNTIELLKNNVQVRETQEVKERKW